MDTNNSDRSHGVTHGSSHSYSERWATTEYMTGTADHTCTGQCARMHLSARVQNFEHYLQQLAMTLPVRDMILYRNAIIDTFTTILGGNTHE